MTQTTIARKQVLILGAGVTGVATARYFQHRNYVVTVADDRNRPSGKNELEKLLPADQLSFGNSLDSLSLTGIDCLVVSPGLPRSLEILERARAEGLAVVSDIEIFLREADAPVIAVTGTNGKSTLVMMIQHLLLAAGQKVLAGGNLGPAALELLAEPTPDFYLLELSSFQLEWLRNPQLAMAVITNITADHLDRYDSFADYRSAKARILGGAGHVVLNLDDADSRQLAMTLPVGTQIDWFGHSETSVVTTLVPLTQVGAITGLLGEHNRVNAQAALTVISALNLTNPLPADPWIGFQGLPHRLQLIATINKVRWVNDSKATNVGATVAAVDGLVESEAGKLVLVVGGEGKGQDFSALLGLAPRLRALVVSGRDGARIGKLFDGLIPVVQGATMPEVVVAAAEAAQPGDTVLLSPACASQDQYRDYQDRGDQFATAVLALADGDQP